MKNKPNCQESISSSTSSTVTELEVLGHTSDQEGAEGETKHENESEDEMDSLLHCSGQNGWETDLDDEDELEIQSGVQKEGANIPQNPDERETLEYQAFLEQTENSQWTVYGEQGEKGGAALQKLGSEENEEDEKDS